MAGDAINDLAALGFVAHMKRSHDDTDDSDSEYFGCKKSKLCE